VEEEDLAEDEAVEEAALGLDLRNGVRGEDLALVALVGAS